MPELLNTEAAASQPLLPSAATTATPTAIDPATLRDPSDPISSRKALYDGVLAAASSIQPTTFGNMSLELSDVRYTDDDKDSDDDEELAIDSKTTLGRRLKGKWVLRNTDTNEVMDEQEQVLGVVPRVTDNGSMIFNGSRYAFGMQHRIRPGAYVRTKKNGELESLVNVERGTGARHRYLMDPDTGLLYFNVENSRIPVSDVLSSLGATKEEVAAVWGDELAETNWKKRDPKAVSKLFDKLATRKEQREIKDPDSKLEAIRAAFDRMRIDPKVSERTLGVATDRVDKNSILAATKKIIDHFNNEVEQDDRDHAAFQTYHGPEDIFAERLKLDAGRIRRQLLMKAVQRGKLVLPTRPLDKQFQSAVFDSGLASLVEAPNPLDIVDRMTRMTVYGDGGIGSADSTPDSARHVNHTYTGFIDGTRSVECYAEGSEVMTFKGWKDWRDVTSEDLLACLVDNQLEWHTPLRLIRKRFAGDLIVCRNAHACLRVTPNHRMYVATHHVESEFRIELARYSYGKTRRMMCGGHIPAAGSDQKFFELPVFSGKTRRRNDHPVKFHLRDWASFLGWYLAEGNVDFKLGKHGGVMIACVHIAKSKEKRPLEWLEITQLLDRMGIRWSPDKDLYGLSFSSVEIAHYVSQFGASGTKYIPDEVFSWPADARAELFRTITAGDGRTRRANDSLKEAYDSGSRRLVEGVSRLAFSLGISSGRITTRIDKRKDSYLPMHYLSLHSRVNRVFQSKSSRSGKSEWSLEPYDGHVYCAQVPGGLLYVRDSMSGCGLWSGNSGKVGADTFIAAGARKGPNGEMYTEVLDPKTNERKWIPASDVYGKVLSLDRTESVPGYFIGVKDGKHDYYKPEEIDYVIPDAASSYNVLSNLVPGKAYMVPHRTGMATRMLAQSVELQNREAPLMQNAVSGTDGAESYEDRFGARLGARFAPEQPGTVTSVKPNAIEYLTADGKKGRIPLYSDATLGRKSRMHSFPLVNVGDRFEPGQLLATSNYTDNNGVAAVGTNLRVADMTHPEAYEDAYVVSESAAKNKLSSVHLYRNRLENSDAIRKGVGPFISVFGGKYKPKQIEKLSKDGVVKVGQVLEKGDPMILAMEVRQGVGRVHKKGGQSFADNSLTYDHDDPGEVVGVFQDKDGNTVVKTRVISPLKEGDKISMRNGLKGVVVIKPDAEMPQDKDGRPFEAIVPRLGVIARKNPIMKHELVLGKLARMRGQAYKIPDFGEIDDLRDFVRGELGRYGVEEKEEVVDPITNTKIPGILTGEAYFLKLHHMSEGKVQGRSTGRYTMDGLPAKGGDDGGKSKRIGLLAQHALLAGGGHEFLRGTGLIRGQQNTDFMRAFLSGDQPPPPQVPERYQKFMDLLKVAGVNPLRRGTTTTLTPMVDREIEKITGGRLIKNGETLDLYRDQKPIPGGLFDPQIFGDGTKSAAMKLSVPLPNPAYAEPMRRLMGLKKAEFRDLIAGKHELPGFGTGSLGIVKFLNAFNLDREINQARADIASGKKTKKDEAVRKLGFLKAMKEQNVDLRDMMRTQVLVLPPNLRPISVMQQGKKQVPIVNDLNYLYKELFDADDNYKSIAKEIGDDNAGDERLALYDTMAALSGWSDPVDRELKQKGVKGALRTLIPGGPKASYLQKKLIGNPADASGRAVIRPLSTLGMDEVGLPRAMAWDMFGNHVVRDLVRRGMPVTRAREELTNKTGAAAEALERVVGRTPVLVTRDPALHQFNTIAQWPKLVDGSSINVNPLVIKPMGGDFDGDQQIGKLLISLPNVELQNNGFNAQAEALESGCGTATIEKVSTKHLSNLVEIPMSSLTKACLPVRHDSKLFLCDLEDFPRLAKTRSSDGRCGHIDWYEVPDGLQVLAINPLSQEVEWATVSDWSVHHGCEVEVVTLRSGRQIFTDDDPRGLIACIPSLGLGTRSCSPSEALEQRGLIPRAQRYGKQSGKPAISEITVPDELLSNRGRSRFKLPKRIQLTSAFGWIVGALCGDGWAEGVRLKVPNKQADPQDEPKRKFYTRGVCLSNSNTDVKRRFEKHVGSLLGVGKHIGRRDRIGDGSRENGYGDSDTSVCQNVGLGKLTRSLIGSKSTGKHLPPFFLTAPERFRRGLLGGLMDTDGGVSVNKSKGRPQLIISFSSTSLRLCREISILAWSLDIRNRVVFSKVTDAGNDSWLVSMNAADVQKLLRQYPKFMAHKDKVSVILNTSVDDEFTGATAARFDLVPITASLAECAHKLIKRNGKTAKERSTYDALITAKKTCYVTRRTALGIVEFVSDRAKLERHPDWRLFWHWAMDHRVTWEPIDSLEKTGKVETGYDITVPGYENWMNIDGVFCPNTMSVHVPMTKGEIDNLKNRLMPSKMLISPQDFKQPMYTPNQDYALGLALAAIKRTTRRSPHIFRTEADAEKALERGEISLHDPIKIIGEK